MFIFISNVIYEDAIKLKSCADLSVEKYLKVSPEEASKRVKSDFGGDGDNFRFGQLPDFQFCLNYGKAPAEYVTVIGEGKYKGFMLMLYNQGTWAVSAENRTLSKRTNSAVKLRNIFIKNYNARDILNEFGGYTKSKNLLHELAGK